MVFFNLLCKLSTFLVSFQMPVKQSNSPSGKKRGGNKRKKANNQFSITEHLSLCWQLVRLFIRIIQSVTTLCPVFHMCKKCLSRPHKMMKFSLLCLITFWNNRGLQLKKKHFFLFNILLVFYSERIVY